MFSYLKQSTASQTRTIGPFVDDTDFKTLETGLTIANTDVKLMKNGGASSNKNSGGGTHRINGMYSLTFDATDTNTVGELAVSVSVAGSLAVVAKFWVLEEDIYDAVYASSAAAFDANQRVDVGSWLGTAVTTSATTSKPEVDVNSVSDDATAANNLELDYDGTGYNKSNSTIGTCTTNTDMITTAAVNAEVDAALSEIGLDHLISASVTGTDVTDNSIVARLVSSAATADWDTFVNTDDSLQAISESGGGGPTAGQIADAVWDEATSGHTTAGTFGEQLATDVDAILTDTNSLNDTKIPDTISLANINTQVDTALTDIGLDHLVSASVTGTDVTDNSIVARLVSSSATADWDTFVNTDDSLQAISESGGGGPTASQIADAVWDEATSGHTTSGTFGEQLKTDVDAILVDTNSLNDTKIPDTISLDNINGEVVDAIDTDTYGELANVPPASSSLSDKIRWMFMMSRNKVTANSTTLTLRNDADSSNVATSTQSDDSTTYTRGEWT